MFPSCRPLAALAGLFGITLAAAAADWPQFLGPTRDGSSPETGLLTTFPASGPGVLWKVEGGDGYSGISVSGGRCYTLVQRNNEELVVALDAATGKEVWKYRLGPAYKNRYGDGPRSTPTVDGKQLYVQSANGPVVCLDAATGKEVWRTDLFQTFKTKNISWGLSASPLIDGNLVLVMPGDPGGVAALDKTTGKTVWHTAKDKAGYASPVVLNVGKKKQIVFFTGNAVLGIDPAGGKELWRETWKTAFDVNIATPLVIGSQVFVSSGENVGCALLEPAGSKVKTIWDSKGSDNVKPVMKNYWATSVHYQGHLYGLSSEHDPPANLRCLDAATGKIVWEKERFPMCNLTLADGHLFILTVEGDLVVAAASSRGYQEKARARVLQKARYVNAPVIADKKLYARDEKSILCLDLAK
jgi:outer membrane protein assembly factor BamB